MRFILGSGEQLKEKLKDFPSPWVNYLLAAKILVIGMIDGEIVAAYGIRSMFNVVTLYVKEGYRGRGIGGQMFEKLINAAQKHGFDFLTAAVFHQNTAALKLFSRFGCRVIKHPKKGNDVIIVCPLTMKGDLTYRFLRIACSMVPDEFLAQADAWISKRTTLK